jgi:hypothetical protein
MNGTGWVDYQSAVELKADSGWAVMRTLGTAQLQGSRIPPGFRPPFGAAGGPNGAANDLPPNSENANLFAPPTVPNQPAQAPKVAQNRALPNSTITLRGYAVRVGQPVPCPGLIYGGGNIYLVPDPSQPQYFHQRIIKTLVNGVPLYYAEWILPYRIVERDTSLDYLIIRRGLNVRTKPPKAPQALPVVIGPAPFDFDPQFGR